LHLAESDGSQAGDHAYNLNNCEVSGQAPLLTFGDTRYDVVARAESNGAPAMAEFRQMLQLLLADRFKLKFHRELCEMPVYELVVGENGPKFKPSAPDANPVAHYGPSGRDYQVTMPTATMADLVDVIASSSPGRPVLDKTGFTGTYDIKLTYALDVKSNRDTAPNLSDVSIFTALQEQLGLRLEAQKAMIEVLVVDYAETSSTIR
jgi:uncharacterized protein (TIGR03435 family)